MMIIFKSIIVMTTLLGHTELCLLRARRYTR